MLVYSQYFKILKYIPGFFDDLGAMLFNSKKIILTAHQNYALERAVKFLSFSLAFLVFMTVQLVPPFISLFSFAVRGAYFLFLALAVFSVYFKISCTIMKGKINLRYFLTAHLYLCGTVNILLVLLVLVSCAVFNYIDAVNYVKFINSLFSERMYPNLCYSSAFEISSFVFTGGLSIILFWIMIMWERIRIHSNFNKDVAIFVVIFLELITMPTALLLFLLIVKNT